MSTQNHNLSSKPQKLPDCSRFKVGIVVSDWNSEVTGRLLQGALDALKEASVPDHQILIKKVPGSFELPFGAQQLAQEKSVHGVITLGCVIQGETRHFDFICQSCADGVMNVGLKYNKPVVFGVLTTNDMQQALDRAGGKHGNKGYEAGMTLALLLENFS